MSRTYSGVVMSFDRERGFGFIRASGVSGDVFVHVSDVEGKQILRPGQRARFAVEPTERGPRAVGVVPGPMFLPPALLSAAPLLSGVATLTIVLGVLGVPWVLAWLASINLATLVVWAWDKHKAVRDGLRVPESLLLGLATIGGSLGAWVGVVGLRHKRRKPRFVAILVAVTVLQLLAVGAALLRA